AHAAVAAVARVPRPQLAARQPGRPAAPGIPVRLACSHATPLITPIRPRDGTGGHNGRVIDELIARMAAMLEPLQAAGDRRRYFHATYRRTTIAVAEEIRRGGFADPGWVERWDVAFAELYLDALQAALADGRPSRPWEI